VDTSNSITSLARNNDSILDPIQSYGIQHLGIYERVKLLPADLIDAASIAEAIEIAEPHEIYHLAAQSFVRASFEQPTASGDINGLGVTRILDAIRNTNPGIRFYQASTSELYGNVNARPKTEDTPFRPASPYAAAKLYGYWMTGIYRESYGIYAVNGILFNHESPLRGMEFVTRKISNAAAKIALGLEKEIALGNLEAKRDWGYAPEYVESMWLMLQQDEPDDYTLLIPIFRFFIQPMSSKLFVSKERNSRWYLLGFRKNSSQAALNSANVS